MIQVNMRALLRFGVSHISLYYYLLFRPLNGNAILPGTKDETHSFLATLLPASLAPFSSARRFTRFGFGLRGSTARIL